MAFDFKYSIKATVERARFYDLHYYKMYGNTRSERFIPYSLSSSPEQDFTQFLGHGMLAHLQLSLPRSWVHSYSQVHTNHQNPKTCQRDQEQYVLSKLKQRIQLHTKSLPNGGVLTRCCLPLAAIPSRVSRSSFESSITFKFCSMRLAVTDFGSTMHPRFTW